MMSPVRMSPMPKRTRLMRVLIMWSRYIQYGGHLNYESLIKVSTQQLGQRRGKDKFHQHYSIFSIQNNSIIFHTILSSFITTKTFSIQIYQQSDQSHPSPLNLHSTPPNHSQQQITQFNFYYFQKIHQILKPHSSQSFPLLSSDPNLSMLPHPGIRPHHATYFFVQLIIIQLAMLEEGEDYCQQPLCKTDASFHTRPRPSLNTTQTTHYEKPTAPTDLFKQDSQPTLPELPPYSSRALDFEQTSSCSPLEAQMGELMQRFAGIHRMLINHSQNQSAMHERKRGFKPLALDPTTLVPDYSNKASIIGDIVTLVEAMQGGEGSSETEEMLQTKFLQYYLERHYGGLGPECNNLSIQEKLDEEEQRQGIVVSKIEGCDSIVRQSNIYSQEAEEELERERWIDVRVQRVRIIQVQIPVVVVRTREEIVYVEESEVQSHLNNNIDSIINRYSKPYADMYNTRKIALNAPIPPQEQIQTLAVPSSVNHYPTPANSNVVASIMIDSAHLPPRQTEIEFIYSDCPEEHAFKLPLDSYAQLESLISHEGSSIRSRPATDRDLIPVNEDGIAIAEKGGGSVLQRLQQGQRALREENLQLREELLIQQEQVARLQAQNRELSAQNNRLARQLQQQIQQTQYFSNKLQEVDAEMLQEKVQSLTHLTTANQRRIQALQLEIAQRDARIAKMTEEIEEACNSSMAELAKKDEEIQQLTRQLLQREAELHELEHCQDTVIEIAASSEQALRREISRLEHENTELQEELRECHKRLRSEGMSLLYDEAAEIQGIIESREHSHRMQMMDITRRYEEATAQYRNQLKQISSELVEVKQSQAAKAQLLATKDAQALLVKIRNQTYYKQFEEIVREYDRELEQKDEEILALKTRITPEQTAALFNKIANLQKQMESQRKQKTKLTQQIMQLDQAMRQLALQQKEQDLESQQRLIQQLSTELQRKMTQNQSLKQKLAEQSAITANLAIEQGRIAAAASLRRQNDKLRDINRRLKRYTGILEEQIKAVCRIDQCESHRTCLSQVIDQKNYFCELLTRENSLLDNPAS